MPGCVCVCVCVRARENLVCSGVYVAFVGICSRAIVLLCSAVVQHCVYAFVTLSVLPEAYCRDQSLAFSACAGDGA